MINYLFLSNGTYNLEATKSAMKLTSFILLFMYPISALGEERPSDFSLCFNNKLSEYELNIFSAWFLAGALEDPKFQDSENPRLLHFDHATQRAAATIDTILLNCVKDFKDANIENIIEETFSIVTSQSIEYIFQDDDLADRLSGITKYLDLGSMDFTTGVEETLEEIDRTNPTEPNGMNLNIENIDRSKVISEGLLFQWRLELERAPVFGEERFLTYQRLLLEIRDYEFTYNGFIYNSNSIRALMLSSFPRVIYRSESLPHADVFFEEMFSWYKNNVFIVREQLFWLENFLVFLSARDGQEAELLTKEKYVTIQQILNEYISLRMLFLRGDREARNSAVAYTQFVLGWVDADNSLSGLYSLVVSEIGQQLRAEETEMIKDFLIPEFSHLDFAVRIYSALSN